jgi:transposase-like protein
MRPEAIEARWRSLAAELGLDPKSVSLAQVGLDGSEDWPKLIVEEALDRLVAHVRLPRWRVDREAGRIVRDPRGSPDLAGLARDLADDLTQRATREHRRNAVAELRSGALRAERVAARWGIAVRTLFRWQRELARTAIREGSMSVTDHDSERTIGATGSAADADSRGRPGRSAA